MESLTYSSGYAYPLTEEEYSYFHDVDFFGNNVVEPPFNLEWWGIHKYLVLIQATSYGVQNHEFGGARTCEEEELERVFQKFESEFSRFEFDKQKIKFFEYCYDQWSDKDYYDIAYDSRRCIKDFLYDLKHCMEKHGVYQICNMGDGSLGFTTTSGAKHLLVGEDLTTTVDDIGRQIEDVAP